MLHLRMGSCRLMTHVGRADMLIYASRLAYSTYQYPMRTGSPLSGAERNFMFGRNVGSERIWKNNQDDLIVRRKMSNCNRNIIGLIEQ